MTEITLDKKTLEALALDSRIDILKALKQRRKTQAELSRELKLSAPTISEHLNKMIKAGLVKKKKQGKKWIYYELTEKGSHIIQPKTTTAFVFALSLSIVLMFIGAYSLVFMQTGTMAAADLGEQSFKAIDNLTDMALTTGASVPELADETEPVNDFRTEEITGLNEEKFDLNISIALMIAGLAILLTAIQRYKKR